MHRGTIVVSQKLCIFAPNFEMESKKYKYQKQIDELIALGCQLPELYAPNNMKACRFVYSDTSRQSHVPQYMTNPKRMLQDVAKGKATTSLLSLSCFTDTTKAESFIPTCGKRLKIFRLLLEIQSLREF